MAKIMDFMYLLAYLLPTISILYIILMILLFFLLNVMLLYVEHRKLIKKCPTCGTFVSFVEKENLCVVLNGDDDESEACFTVR